MRNIHSTLSNAENINIKAKYVIYDPEIVEFISNNKPENSEKEGDENYEMYKYLMENVFKILNDAKEDTPGSGKNENTHEEKNQNFNQPPLEAASKN